MPDCPLTCKHSLPSMQCICTEQHNCVLWSGAQSHIHVSSTGWTTSSWSIMCGKAYTLVIQEVELKFAYIRGNYIVWALPFSGLCCYGDNRIVYVVTQQLMWMILFWWAFLIGIIIKYMFSFPILFPSLWWCVLITVVANILSVSTQLKSLIITAILYQKWCCQLHSLCVYFGTLFKILIINGWWNLPWVN